MPVISQNLTLPGNVQTGGTIQASDVSTLYQAMNAFNIPNTIGVWQQALVDNNRYQSTGSGSIDWSLTTPVSASKSIFFMIPFAWSGSTGNNYLFQIRVNGAVATTSTTLVIAAVAAGNALFAGFIGSRSTDADSCGFVLGMDNANSSLRLGHISNPMSTSDITSIGFVTSTALSATFVYNGIRFWSEG